MRVTNMCGRGLLILAAFLVGLSGSAAAAQAQSSVTPAEIQRLQATIFDASREVAQLRSRDAAEAARLQGQLDDASDEAIYLKVKLRKDEFFARSEYTSLRDRVDSIRGRVLDAAAPPPPPPVAAPPPPPPPAVRNDRPAAPDRAQDRADVPVGTEFDVRLSRALSSATAQVEDRFEATTAVDLREGNRVIVPAGSVMRGIVSSVKRPGRVDRTGVLTVAFDRITVGTRSYPIRATVTDAIQSEGIKGDAGKIGAGAGVGAILGAILGGGKGALAGILIGGGGTIAATEGKDVELAPGTILRVRMDTALNLR
jgi:hypothetical protein